jgi:hypothetical protein
MLLNAMKMKMVSYTLDRLPTLTQRANLKALKTRPDSDIDSSDNPEMTDAQWKNARRGHFYRPISSRSIRGLRHPAKFLILRKSAEGRLARLKRRPIATQPSNWPMLPAYPDWHLSIVPKSSSIRQLSPQTVVGRAACVNKSSGWLLGRMHKAFCQTGMPAHSRAQ